MLNRLRRLRVDDVPFYINPIIKLYGWTGAAIWSSMLRYWRTNCRWKFVKGEEENITATNGKSPGRRRRNNNEEQGQPLLPYKKQCIHITWHENVPAYMCFYWGNVIGNDEQPLHENHVWLQHPAVYMAPIHALLTKYNVKYVLGSSGHDGQQALSTLQHEMITNNF